MAHFNNFLGLDPNPFIKNSWFKNLTEQFFLGTLLLLGCSGLLYVLKSEQLNFHPSSSHFYTPKFSSKATSCLVPTSCYKNQPVKLLPVGGCRSRKAVKCLISPFDPEATYQIVAAGAEPVLLNQADFEWTFKDCGDHQLDVIVTKNGEKRQFSQMIEVKE